MRKQLATAITAIAAFSMFFVTATTAAATQTDPRECSSDGGRIPQGRVDGPTFCAYQAASLAFRRHLGGTVLYQGPTRCTEGRTNLIWACSSPSGNARVLFTALSNGWHIRVAP